MWLPFVDFSLFGLSMFAVFYGLDWIATVPPTVKLAAKTFGREQAPLMFGWVFTGHQLGAATAALMAGISRDTLASYLPAFYTAGFACLVAAVAVPVRPAAAAELAPVLAWRAIKRRQRQRGRARARAPAARRASPRTPRRRRPR